MISGKALHPGGRHSIVSASECRWSRLRWCCGLRALCCSPWSSMHPFFPWSCASLVSTKVLFSCCYMTVLKCMLLHESPKILSLLGIFPLCSCLCIKYYYFYYYYFLYCYVCVRHMLVCNLACLLLHCILAVRLCL